MGSHVRTSHGRSAFHGEIANERDGSRWFHPSAESWLPPGWSDFQIRPEGEEQQAPGQKAIDSPAPPQVGGTLRLDMCLVTNRIRCRFGVKPPAHPTPIVSTPSLIRPRRAAAPGSAAETLREPESARGTPGRFWTKGAGDHVDSAHFDPDSDKDDGLPSPKQLLRWDHNLKDALARARAGDSSPPFRKVHPDERSWLIHATGTLCPFNALRSAVIICLTEEARQRLIKLLNREKQKHFQDPTMPTTEEQVLLVDQINGRQFQEVFLSAEFGPASPRELLILAVSAARVGLHLVRLAPRA